MAFQEIANQGGEDAAKSSAWLARNDLRLHKVPDAEAAARKALELSPNLPTGHAALGEVYFREGKFGDAEKEFLTPIRASIPDPRSYLGEARISWATSNYKHAKQMIDKAHTLDPQDQDIEENWMRTLSRAERIKFLQARFEEGAQGLDSDEERNTEAYLKILQDREGRPAAACHQINKVPSTEMPFENLAKDARVLRGLGLKVTLDGTPSTLLLDTGAGGILVNTKIAERAGLRKIADIALGGIGSQGAANGYLAYANSIQIGGLEFQGCYVDVVDKKRSMNEDGYIGADVFENYLVELNFPDRKLKLSELPKRPNSEEQSPGLKLDSDAPHGLHDRYIAPEMQSWERFYRFGHYILLPTMVNVTTNSRLFLLDTGSEQVHLSLDLARQVTKVHGDDLDTLKGASGKVERLYQADAVTLAFARYRLKAEDVVAFDISDLCNGAGVEISGILGFSLLFQLDIKIDYRDGLIGFDYNPNRFH